MKFKKAIILLFVMFLALVLVACGGNGANSGDENSKSDPLVPVSIALKVKVAKVQINTELKMTYTITPATAQGDKVTVELDKNDLATAVVEGTNTVKLSAGSMIGTVKVTVYTSNGLKASKTIKIQEEAVESYPDLSGYNIKLAQATQALGEYDVKLTKDTAAEYGYYDKGDREAKILAWDEIEDNYNCVLSVEPYPADAPWGGGRWQYILTQAQNESPEYDFYVAPDAQIPGFVAGNAILDLTDWYAQYGKNLMSEKDITAASYKQRLYGINDQEVNIQMTLCYNLNLYDILHEADPTIEEPAQMFLDNNWDYESFEEYCIKVQNALNTMYGVDSGYYCLSGFGTYYWLNMVNAGGVRILDTTQLKVSILGSVEAAAAETLRNIFINGAMDPAMQVDQGNAAWNNEHALFNTGAFWFINSSNRWSKDLWGSEENTRYGFVPFPKAPGMDSEGNYVGVTTEASILMAAGRDWAYRGFGEECTAENIYRAVMDYYTTARANYHGSETYDREADTTAYAQERFASEASVKAYVRLIMGTQNADGSYSNGIDEYGFFDPYVGDNPIMSSYGGTGTFAGSVANFIKNTEANQWIDAVGQYEETIKKSLVESYG